MGISYVYRLIDTDRMGEPTPDLCVILEQVEQFGFSGLNVTFPYKQAILPLLHELSSAARDVGAVNTVVLSNGRRVGHNTDLWGFREAFRRGLPTAPRGSVLLLGAGGAGRAVAHALLDCGVDRLLVCDSERERAEALVRGLDQRYGAAKATSVTDLGQAAGEAQGIVNATPIGMAKQPGMPIDGQLLESRHWVADIIYFPLETELLRHARRIGCATMSGEGMAVFQAVRAFALFTGLEPDTNRMKSVFADFGGASPTAGG